MLIKDDCEKYSNEDEENRVADREKKQSFRRTLDRQVSDSPWLIISYGPPRSRVTGPDGWATDR
jgi:hypothetical protein